MMTNRFLKSIAAAIVCMSIFASTTTADTVQTYTDLSYGGTASVVNGPDGVTLSVTGDGIAGVKFVPAPGPGITLDQITSLSYEFSDFNNLTSDFTAAFVIETDNGVLKSDVLMGPVTASGTVDVSSATFWRPGLLAYQPLSYWQNLTGGETVSAIGVELGGNDTTFHNSTITIGSMTMNGVSAAAVTPTPVAATAGLVLMGMTAIKRRRAC